ncbi:hypothetical protein F5148DRAFT_1227360 [Russula earlei]|uniref:Uncharacterized protein n=1 Tax=Russula earlei TaxID=71964 RepID=A0ACC0U0K3_9AGAM|nr:hypothetical protein F5148DRAFT_1227360 [Russula earlei]
MTLFFPSITFCVCGHDSMPMAFRAIMSFNSPSTGLQSHAAATLLNASVTCQFLLPTLTSRIASSAADHAAHSASARRLVTGLSGVAPTTIVSAMYAPRCSFTTSPLESFCVDRGSELRTHDSGEKCATQLFTDMDVGRAIFAQEGRGEFWEGCTNPFTDLLYTAAVPSSIKASTVGLVVGDGVTSNVDGRREVDPEILEMVVYSEFAAELSRTGRGQLGQECSLC